MKLKLKNYPVIKKIGHGGMGLVYVAEDLSLGRLVALKVLAPYLVQAPEILERFRFEARNQAQLKADDLGSRSPSGEKGGNHEGKGAPTG